MWNTALPAVGWAGEREEEEVRVTDVGSVFVASVNTPLQSAIQGKQVFVVISTT